MQSTRASMLTRVAAFFALISAVAAGAVPPEDSGRLPFGHVFVIVLENKDYDVTFGPRSPAPYLARTLTRQGVLLHEYYGVAHFSLPNYLAFLSGQAANPDTRSDCETYTDFVATGVTSDGQVIGRGCVYPANVKTLVDQLDDVGRSWKAYAEDMGNDPSRETRACGHPALDSGDPTQNAEAPSTRVPVGDQYAARHNPFIYFHSILDTARCVANVVRLEDLRRDIRSEHTTPDFAFIVPNLCHDGHDAPCVTHEPGGLASVDSFLRNWVPRILASPAYRHDGLLIITFDEGDAEVRQDGNRRVMQYQGRHCCNQQPGVNLEPYPYEEEEGEWTYRFADFGGDRVGTVLLSPFLSAGTSSRTPFNHYSLLRTLEDLYGTRSHLGYAAQTGLVGLFEAGSDVHWHSQVR